MFTLYQITDQSDKMFALIFYFILQLTKSNGYDGKRGLTGVGIIGETDPGCQCQCFDPHLGIKNQSSEFVYIQPVTKVFWQVPKTV